MFTGEILDIYLIEKTKIIKKCRITHNHRKKLCNKKLEFDLRLLVKFSIYIDLQLNFKDILN